MPRSTYIPVKSRTIGRGKHMDSVVLKKFYYSPAVIVRASWKSNGVKARYCRKSMCQGT